MGIDMSTVKRKLILAGAFVLGVCVTVALSTWRVE